MTTAINLAPLLNVAIQIVALVALGFVPVLVTKAASWLHIQNQSALLQRVVDIVDRGINYAQNIATTRAATVSIGVSNPLVADAANYVIAKAPDALKALKMDSTHVADLVLARLPPIPAVMPIASQSSMAQSIAKP